MRAIHDNKSSLHLNESEGASYSSKGNQLFLLVMTFDSSENSRKAFTLLTRGLSREDDLKDIGEKKKGWSSVGERLEVNIITRGRIAAIESFGETDRPCSWLVDLKAPLKKN